MSERSGNQGPFSIDGHQASHPTMPPELTAMQMQSGALDFLASNGLYRHIAPESFPALPQNRIVSAFVAAAENALGGLRSAESLLIRSKDRRRVRHLMTEIVHDRNRFMDALGGGDEEPDAELIAPASMTRQPGDLTQEMGYGDKFRIS
jgi:hypothetical protein